MVNIKSKSSPLSSKGSSIPGLRTAPWRRRLLYVPLFGVIGVVLGGLLGSVGFVALTIGFEAALTPPLMSPPNYGQFIIFVLQTAILLAAFGTTIGLIPIIRWKAYCGFYLVGFAIVVFYGPREELIGPNLREAPTAAILCLFLVIPFLALGMEMLLNRELATNSEEVR